MTEPQLDFQLLFEESPDVLLVLLPDAPRYTMVGATRARLLATQTTREQTIGKGLFEIFPDNPDDTDASGTTNLRASLDRVLATRAADTMPVQKYDIRDADGNFMAKYWSPKNIPVLAADGTVKYIIHRVEDVTELVHANELRESLRDRSSAMENEVIQRSRELAETIRELRAANLKLGELDTAKTTFFSNISHEFRTPLTLMLAPIEDALADNHQPLSPANKQRLQLARDNSLRLLKLVNTLLDFSRIEAGRIQASYAPVDVACFTTELVAMFQSAADKAGIRLIIDCPAVSEPVWIDREMWEKIIPNLVSNALKFTFAGEVAVRLREHAAHITIDVIDTGIGIPEAELPHIFERFYRVSGNSGRTYEGTGIGLSLVRELIELHGGRINVQSTVNKGTSFHIEIPKGNAHLPAASLASQTIDSAISRDVAAHVTEASSWESDISTSKSSASRAQILVVDDNPDLREYIATLLASDYDVVAVPDGLAALDAVHIHRPDIVVSDVMMPRLDGFGLVRALRADAATATLPVILLSARAGEDASIDGLDAGADDYLVKPFSARELLARVRTHLELARTRRLWIEELERANKELDAFSYSVSHDLRAPLRAIDSLGIVLEEDYAAAIDNNGKRLISQLRSHVQRAFVLIEALLDLARIARSDIEKQAVDLSAMASTIVNDLRTAHPDRKVKLDIEQSLQTVGDRQLLNVVLTNLIGNAWKYTGKKNGEARIAVGFDKDQSAYFVRDNGVGFDMAQAGQLFTPFQRLHSASEFAGTGVGLTTVQRAVERQGGRIWADAEVDKGATFYFTVASS